MRSYKNIMTDVGLSKMTMVFDAPKTDASYEDAIGDIVAISKDNCRTYVISSLYVKHEGQRICIIPNCEDEEAGWSGTMLRRHFVEECEEVTIDGYTTVWQKTIVDAMVELSEKLDLGWVIEEHYDEATKEEGWRVYRRDFAEKAYIGQDVLFCFSTEALVEALREESISSFCDFKKHEVIMQDADGSFEEDEAYVIIRDKLTVRFNREEV